MAKEVEVKVKLSDNQIKELIFELEQVNKLLVESEEKVGDLEKANKKLTDTTKSTSKSILENGGAMGLLNDATGGLAMQLKDAVEAMGLFTVTEEANTVATEEATVATVGFGNALKIALTGGLIIVLGLIVTYWEDIKAAITGATKETKAYAETQQDATSEIAKATTELIKQRELFKEADAGLVSREETLKKYNDTFGDTLGKTDDYNTAEQRFAANTSIYLKVIALRATAEAALAKAVKIRTDIQSGKYDELGNIDTIIAGIAKFVGASDNFRNNIIADQRKEALAQQNTFTKIWKDNAKQADELSSQFNAVEINKNYDKNEQLKKDNKKAGEEAEKERVKAFEKKKADFIKETQEISDLTDDMYYRTRQKDADKKEAEKKKDHDHFIALLQGQAAYYTNKQKREDDARALAIASAKADIEGMADKMGFSKSFDLLNTVTKDGFKLTKDNILEMANLATDALQETLNFASQMKEESIQHDIDNLDNQKAAELKSVGDNEQAKAAIEAKFAQKKLELEKKLEQQKKQQAIINVVIDTAQAIVKTGASLGYPAAIPFIALAAALGIAQIAAINSASNNKINNLSASAANVSTGTAGSSGTSALTPNVQLIGTGGGNANSAISENAQQNNMFTVNAVVSETEITNTQNFISKVKSSAEI
jgi:hypothetical protein